MLENDTCDPLVLHGVEIPGHSVAICIYGGSDAEIAETIYNKKDAGCGTTGNHDIGHTVEVNGEEVRYAYKILRPTTVPVGIRVTYNKTQFTKETAAQDIKEAVVSDFLGQNEDSGDARVGLASTVYASRFSVAVVKTADVQDLVSIEIRLGSGPWGSSIVIDGNTEPVITQDDVIVVEVE